MFFKRTDHLTSNLTSYDFIKFAALILMLLDHLGAFFMQDELWLRMLGRMSFPVFFFLAGYSANNKVKTDIFLGAVILLGGSAALGSYIFPLNALFTYVFIKMFLRVSAEKTFSGWEPLLYTFAALMFLAWPTNQIFEYGSFGFLIGLMGYAVRHHETIHLRPWMTKLFFVATLIPVALWQCYTFNFNTLMSWGCILSLLGMGYIFYHFKYIEFPSLTERLGAPVSKLIQFGGRYTLEIYVIHLLMIKAYMLYAQYGHYNWFSPTQFPS